MPFSRASGILLHPTSFPGRFGIGDLGLEAYRFVDFLVQSGQQLWQILPLGPTGDSNSPYASYSAMAGNPLLISPELLQNKGLLAKEDFANLPKFSTQTVDFSQVIQTKMPMDILGLGTQARMNFPGKDLGNWGWRYQPTALTPEVCDRLKAITETYGRVPIVQEPSDRSIYSQSSTPLNEKNRQISRISA